MSVTSNQISIQPCFSPEDAGALGIRWDLVTLLSWLQQEWMWIIIIMSMKQLCMQMLPCLSKSLTLIRRCPDGAVAPGRLDSALRENDLVWENVIGRRRFVPSEHRAAARRTTVWNTMYFAFGRASSNADKEQSYPGGELLFEKRIIERAEDEQWRLRGQQTALWKLKVEISTLSAHTVSRTWFGLLVPRKQE